MMNWLKKWGKRFETAFIWLSIGVCGAIGSGIYLMIAKIGGFRPAVDVLLCCIGYPGVIFGFLGSLFFLYQNEE